MSLDKAQPIYDYFTSDHRRLDAILEEAIKDRYQVHLAKYDEFRIGLLTHMKMEEKILFVAAQKANGGSPLPLQSKLRLDHGALTSLLVCYPTPALLAVLEHILEIHDELEEKQGGMYQACEKLTLNDRDAILVELKAVTPVPIRPINEAQYAIEAAQRSVERAGFNWDELYKA